MLLVGAMQVAMGLLRLGFVVILLSRPVIAGFTSAAALIIAASQIGNLLGMSLARSENVFVLLWDAVQHVGQVDPWSLALGGGKGGRCGEFGSARRVADDAPRISHGCGKGSARRTSTSCATRR